MSEPLFDFFVYTVAACHVISLAYLFYANYVRVRYPWLRKTASTTATIVAIPWLIYAVFFVVLHVACADAGETFLEVLPCVLDVLWIFYLGLSAFAIAFIRASWLCWTLLSALHGRPSARPEHYRR